MHNYPDARGYIIAVMFCLVWGAFLLPGCSDNKDKPALSQMHFNVDSSLLNYPVQTEVASFSFAAPKNWNRIPRTRFAALQQQLAPLLENGVNPGLELVSIFYDESSGGLCSICKIRSFPSDSAFQDSIKSYLKRLQSAFTSSAVYTGEYLKENIHIYQLLIQNPQIVNFKIIFKTNPNQAVQIDYVVPKKEYSRQIKAIESSIGSIKQNAHS